jgi:hypothetical protein
MKCRKKNKRFSLSAKKLEEKDVKFVSSQINNIQIAYILMFKIITHVSFVGKCEGPIIVVIFTFM